MKRYLFEYLVDTRGLSETAMMPIMAVDAMDAFDMFRASHPHALISHVWVEWAA